MKNSKNSLLTVNGGPVKFLVVGLLPSTNFQKCRFLTEKLHTTFPKKYSKPEVRPMLNLDWDTYLTKMRRRFGKNFYLLQSPVVVFMNGDFLGDEKALESYISKSYVLRTDRDFEEIANEELIRYLSNIIDKEKLYTDLVPNTCENFLNRCNYSQEGYRGAKIHRIVKYSWIQCGGWNLKSLHMACENYVVPHDRRGVLSMANSKRHTDNSTQFFITLNPASWMDYKYVAFGQLVQGAEILNQIEKIPTNYQNPTRRVSIVGCGEFSLCPRLDADEETKRTFLPHPEDLGLFNSCYDRTRDVGDALSTVISERAFRRGIYCLQTDLKSYLPFSRYSKMFEEYLKEIERSTRPVGEDNFAQLLEIRRIEEEEERKKLRREKREREKGERKEMIENLLRKYNIAKAGEHLIF